MRPSRLPRRIKRPCAATTLECSQSCPQDVCYLVNVAGTVDYSHKIPGREPMSKDVTRYDPELAKGFRKLPPLADLTRVQKSFLLEPWYTVGMVVSGVLAAASLVTAAIMWNFRPLWVGLVFIAVAVCFAIAKKMHRDENVKVEGTLRAAPKRESEWDR